MKYIYKPLALVFILFQFCQSVHSQDTASVKIDTAVKYTMPSISADTLPPTKKRFWRASGELMMVQVIPWSYNYFVRDAEFAHISWESIKYNLDFSHWEWDDNNFKTNQFAHPYHGSMYFSAFRTNGYNFWQSAPAALAGSYMWEVAGETHPAAPNDLINTTLGGITLGEMSYRLSNLIVNNRQRGFKRQLNEVLGFLVNPMNGFNRILDGKWGRYMPNAADRRPAKVLGELDMGGRRFNEKGDNDFVTKGKNEFYLRMRLLYGDPFKDRKKPFQNFSFAMELGSNDSAKLNTLRVVGFLHGWDLTDSTATHHHVLDLTANYDYFRNSAFYYGAQSVGMSLHSRFNTGGKTKIETQAGVGGIILAAVQDEYLYYGEGRNYDFGPGFSLLGDVNLLLANKLFFGVHYRAGWFKTVNGNESTHFLNAVTSELRYFFNNRISLGTEYGHFNLKGYFKDFADVSHSYPYGRISLGYKFDF